jgi:divalent metal cation (Fe/Co/Zn/Cd) transporter
MATATNSSTPDRAELVRRGQFLEYLTLAACSVEALVSIAAGVAAGSVALMGFGFDSVIEVVSGGAILWRLHKDADIASRQERDGTTLRIVGWCFFALTAYVIYESLRSLFLHEAPAPSVLGICIAVFSLVTMKVLSRAKRRVAQGISSAAMNADAQQTALCSYLSAILLGGLVLNAAFGWWWTDPVAGLFMVPLIAKEGFDALRGKSCACWEGCR